MAIVLLKCVLLMVLSVGLVKSDMDKDREECATQVVGLAPCLPYAGGTSKAPTPECCTGVKQVITNSKKCLCILIKDRDDPSLGLKLNATLSIGIPKICKTNFDISVCPALLHLSPDSPEAKVFEDFNNIANGNGNGTTPTPTAPATKETPKSGSSNAGSSPPVKNNGGMRINRWLGLKMVGGVLLWWLASYY